MVDHNLVERISNQIFKPCLNLSLKHHVKIASKDRDNKRSLYHSEYEYNSNTYVDTNKLISIKLNYYSYLTLEEENSKDWNEKSSIMIMYSDIYYIRKKFKKVAKWFDEDDKEYDDLYFIDEDRLVINQKYNNLSQTIKMSTNNTVIYIVPTVITDKDGEDCEGISMYINKNDKKFDIEADRFITLKCIIDEFDLYLAGYEAINYLGRPSLKKFMNVIENEVGPAKSKEGGTYSKGLFNKRRDGFNSL